jgi:hypothetical protein
MTDQLTCNFCGLSWSIPSELELTSETLPNFTCKCQQKPNDMVTFVKCLKHMYGNWEINPLAFHCNGCENEFLKSKEVRFPAPGLQGYRPFTTPMEQDQAAGVFKK